MKPEIVFTIIIAYFILGASITFFINKKCDTLARKKNWMKLAIYLIVVSSIMASFYMNQLAFQLLAFAIVLRGFYEFVLVEIRNRTSNIFSSTSITIFLIISFLFIKFSHLSMEIKISTFLIITVTDGFSQITGQLLGKTKFLATISPSKTLEGFIGGILFALLTAVLTFRYTHMELSYLLILTTLIAISSQAGDLLASFYKRKHKIKDFPLAIPYHGGFLDRFDSFLVAGASVELFLM